MHIDDGLDLFKVHLASNGERLYELLWGSHGPFSDGYQLQDWIAVTALVSNWMMEVLVNISHIKKDYNKLKEFINEHPEYIAIFTCDFFVELIDHGIIKFDEETKILVKYLLKSKVLIPSLVNGINAIIDVITEQCNCCYLRSKSEKKIKKQLRNLTELKLTECQKNKEILKRLS